MGSLPVLDKNQESLEGKATHIKNKNTLTKLVAQ